MTSSTEMILAMWRETPPPAPKVNRFYPAPKSRKAIRLADERQRMLVANRADWRRGVRNTRKVFGIPYERPPGSYGFRFRMR